MDIGFVALCVDSYKWMVPQLSASVHTSYSVWAYCYILKSEENPDVTVLQINTVNLTFDTDSIKMLPLETNSWDSDTF